MPPATSAAPAPAPRTSPAIRVWASPARLRLAALATAVLLAGFLAWTSGLRRSLALVATAVPTRTTRQNWAVDSTQGRITGCLDTIALRSPPADDPGPLFDLVLDPVSSRVLAADASGRLRALTAPPARPPADGRFDGLLAGVRALDDGRLVFCLGRSGFGQDYFLLWLDPRTPAAAAPPVATNFCTRLLATNGRDVWFATQQARLTQVTPAGVVRWQRVLDQVPRALAVAADGTAAVGDDRGNLTVVTADGASARVIRLGDFPITALGWLAGPTLLACDTRGVLTQTDCDGERLRRLDLGTAPGRVRTMVQRGPSTYLVTDRGQVLQLSGLGPRPAWPLRSLDRLERAGAGLLAAAAALLALAGSRRVRDRLGRTARQVLAARAAYLLLLPSFGLLAVFCYYPMLTALGYSFVKFSLTSPAEFVGLDNFLTLARDPYLARSLLNMLVLLLTGLAKLIVLPLLAAELVFWLPWRGWQQFFRSALIFPAVVPGVVMVLVWKMIYDPYSGLLNVTLHALGYRGAPPAWLGDERLALGSVAFYNFPWINLLIFLIFLGGLLQIDRSLFEAAEVDGAGILQRFRHLELPALRPKLSLAVTLIFIWSVQDFASVLILTGGGPGLATYVPALQMFQQISDGHNLGASSALGCGLFLLVVAFTALSLRYNREHES